MTANTLHSITNLALNGYVYIPLKFLFALIGLSQFRLLFCLVLFPIIFSQISLLTGPLTVIFNTDHPFWFPQLHTIVTDDTCVQVTELYQQEQPNGATGGSSATQPLRALTEAAYQKKGESLLSDENCYKIIIVRFLFIILIVRGRVFNAF